MTIWATHAPPFEAQIYYAGRFWAATSGGTAAEAESTARALIAEQDEWPIRYEQAGAFTVAPNARRTKFGGPAGSLHPEPHRNRWEAAGVNGLTALGETPASTADSSP